MLTGIIAGIIYTFLFSFLYSLPGWVIISVGQLILSKKSSLENKKYGVVWLVIGPILSIIMTLIVIRIRAIFINKDEVLYQADAIAVDKDSYVLFTYITYAIYAIPLTLIFVGLLLFIHKMVMKKYKTA